MAHKASWTTSPVVGSVVGVFAGGLTIPLLESGGRLLLGTADPGDLSSVTTPMFVSVLVAWVVGAGGAGLVATAWSRTSSIVPAAAVGIVLLAASFSNLLAIPHPAWMMIAAVILMPAAAILAGRLRAGWTT